MFEIRLTRGKAINLNRPFKWIQRKFNLQNSVGSSNGFPTIEEKGVLPARQNGNRYRKNKILYRYKQVRGSKLTLRMLDHEQNAPL